MAEGIVPLFLLVFVITGCRKVQPVKEEQNAKESRGESSSEIDPGFKINLNPAWQTGAPVFLNGSAIAFDVIAVKDLSVVFFEGKCHLFYTGRNKGTDSQWKIGYTSASGIAGLKAASSRTLMTSLNGGGYFCAPQVFCFSSQKKWYLVYQSGKGATFSTTTNISDPVSWAAGQTMGFSDGIDFWVVSNNKDSMFCFYSAQDGSRTIKRRGTSLKTFPYFWSDYTVVADNTFEAVHVYKNQPDGKYYMMVEDITRHFELWVADTPGVNGQSYRRTGRPKATLQKPVNIGQTMYRMVKSYAVA